MALTKEDKEDIKQMIAEAIGGKSEDRTKMFDDWKKNGIKSKLTGLTIAPEDYTEGDKKFFTWDEVMALELPDGWRLPTRSEWALICEEFGQDENGRLSGKKLEENLGLAKHGYLDDDDDLCNQGIYGYYWSSTAVSSAFYAYYLYFSSGGVGPAYGVDKSAGFAVRLVKDIK